MSTNATEMIIPFGKYKGEDITKLFADQQYLKWCQDQPWFKEKYSNIYNIVVNQTIVKGGVGDKTPEHNRIQNLFLDTEVCVKLLQSGSTYTRTDCGKYYSTSVEYEICEQCTLCDIHRKLLKYQYSNDYISETEYNQISECVKCTQCVKCIHTERKYWIKPKVEFEGIYNWDIIIKCDRHYTKLIEVKPLLGDDYPNVLRKMKNQIKLTEHNKHSSRIYDISPILLINNFNSVNTSKADLIKIFAQSDISIIFLSDLDINLNQQRSIEDENKLLKQYLSSQNIDYQQILAQA